MLIPTLTFAGQVEWGVVEYNLNTNWHSGGNYFSIVGASPLSMFLTAEFCVAFTMALSSSKATLFHYDARNNWALTTDYSWWRVVDKGTAVNYDTMLVGQDDYFSYFWGDKGTVDISIPLTNAEESNTVILAFAAGFPDYYCYYYYYYGWVELGYKKFDGGNMDIYIVNSAMETTGLGIYAGTGNIIGDAIPEPSSALLALSALALLLRRHRKRPSTPRQPLRVLRASA